MVVLTVKLMTCLWRYVITDAPNSGGHVPVDMTPSALHLCAGPPKLHLSCPGDTNHAADECTVALCVPVSVVKQRRLDLIDKLQLRTPQFSARRYRASVEHHNGHANILVRNDTGCCATADKRPAGNRDVHRQQQNQTRTATTVDDGGRQSREHNAMCDVTSKPAMPLPMSTARTATSTPEPP